MSNKPGNIFNEGRCLTTEELLAYAQGRLSGAEAHRAEKHLLDCDFCSEALEGIMNEGDLHKVPQLIDELNERIDAVSGKSSPVRATYFSFRKIAAVVALLIVTGGLWVYIGRMNRSEKLFSQYYEPYQPATDSIAEIKPQPEATIPPEAALPPEAAPVFNGKSLPQTTAPKVIAEEKKANDGKQVETTTLKDEVTVGYNAAQEDVVVQAEGASTQGALAKAPSDDVIVTQNESDELAADKSKNLRSKSTESLSKEVPASATFSTKRETEFADVRVDAAQLQRAPLQEAIHLYEAGVYEEAFQKAEKFLKKFPKDEEGLFYSGVSALSLKKEKVAAERLEDCLATGAQQWKEEASWYLSLCYVKLGKPQDAKPLLQFLARGTSIHAGEAKKMLESIH
jgi:TolA-binding protein